MCVCVCVRAPRTHHRAHAPPARGERAQTEDAGVVCSVYGTDEVAKRDGGPFLSTFALTLRAVDCAASGLDARYAAARCVSQCARACVCVCVGGGCAEGTTGGGRSLGRVPLAPSAYSTRAAPDGCSIVLASEPGFGGDRVEFVTLIAGDASRTEA